MTEGKLNFSIGNLTFSSEGDENWVAEQMQKVIAALPTLGQVAAVATSSESQNNNGTSKSNASNVGTLASHLKTKSAETNQNKRFLAAADWLRLRGNTKLTTGMVSKALNENQQKRLGNPADCLNQNVGKGFCEKTSDGFFITPEGLQSLGYN
jgi:hypothetical protein